MIHLAPRFRWICLLLACLAAAPFAPHAVAQAPVVDASDLHQPTSIDEGWIAMAGDNPAWADPNFDDSHWPRFNPRTDSLHKLFPNQQPTVVWYRLHFKVAPHDTSLAVEEWFLSSAFEIYANGVKILSSGSVNPASVNDQNGRLLAKIPSDQIASGKIILAVRSRISHSEWTNAYPGFYYYNLVFGTEESLREHIWLAVVGDYAVEAMETLISLGMIAGGLLLYSAQRRPEYFFLVLSYIVGILSEPLNFYGAMHTFPASWGILSALTALVYPYLIARTYLAFIAWPVSWRMNVFLALVCIGSCADKAMNAFYASNIFSIILVELPTLVLTLVVLPVLLISAMRRGNREAGILLIPLLLISSVKLVDLCLFSLAQIPALRESMWHLRDETRHMTAGPFRLTLDHLTSILASLSLALIILLRSNRQSRQQAQLESEFANAREVQQVILPETSATVPGFHIESAYQPAQQVGGDFFQVLPDGAGGLIAVIGDVAGKGLPAAMLVSVLVGAIRTAADYTRNPAEILAQLNDRLLGRARGGFSTAIAAHISADGTVTIANAGHLSPYLDGREIDLPGALPLGIDAHITYATHTFTLGPRSRLVFYSDGVVEAQNASGELLGFDRAAKLSTEPVEKISQTAQAFGQSDDITVVAIAREAAVANAA